MNAFAQGRPKLIRNIALEKANFARSHTADGGTYFESNHCFIKGFGWYITEHFSENEIGAVILTRNKVEIVKSYYRIGCSPLTSYGRKWILTPMLRNPIVQPPRSGQLSPRATYRYWNLVRHLILPFQFLYRQLLGAPLGKPKCLVHYELEALRWYVEETRAQTEIFIRKHPNIRCYRIDISELNDEDKILQMLDYFGLEPTPTLRNIAGKRTNLKAEAD